MFYAQFVLSKKGPLAKIWLAAHWEKKLTKAQVFETNIDKAVESILEPKVKMALRTTGHLLLGVVRIYSRKAKYLLADCNEAFTKIKQAFRPGALVDLPEQGREANLNAITLPEVFHDFDSALPDFNDFEYQQQLTLNQSRFDDITMKEDVPTTSYPMQDDEFGDEDGMLDDEEHQRDPSVSNVSRLSHSMVKDLRSSGAGGQLDIDAPILDDGFGGNLDDNFLDADLNIFDEQFDGFDQGGIQDIDFDDNEEINRRKTPKPVDAPSALGAKSVTSSELTTEVTTLIQNEDESFALEPLDATAATGVEKKTKRKRRLIVDEVKAISGEDMKLQISDAKDTVTCLEVAPPSKRLMKCKETGVVDKLFAAPCLQFSSKQLIKILAGNIAQRSKKEDLVEAAAEGALILDDLESLRGANAASPGPRRGVSPIPEDVLGETRVDNENGMADIDQAQLGNDNDENMMMLDDLQPNGGLPSVSSQPASPWAPAMEEQEPPAVISAPPSPRKERKSKSSQPKEDRYDEDEVEGEDQGGEEDKRWSKRTQQILAIVRNRLKKDDYVTFVDLCARRDNRKIAAQKFYTLLVLKKWKAIEVEQDESYGEIRIREGPRMNESLHV